MLAWVASSHVPNFRIMYRVLSQLPALVLHCASTRCSEYNPATLNLAHCGEESSQETRNALNRAGLSGCTMGPMGWWVRRTVPSNDTGA
ncbi:hypothetical protein GGR53DRAFT_320760 [Hypoxylon sp. FL1150]|nr:hypothetical protein GGR53DRAFT_320760 [Hypoxylon sp. FL1150]